jgi:hypothetical protein
MKGNKSGVLANQPASTIYSNIRVTFYTVNPTTTVDKDDLYDLAMSRIDILRELEIQMENKEKID